MFSNAAAGWVGARQRHSVQYSSAMASDTTAQPDAPAEAHLIRVARLAVRIPAAQAARDAGISKARWSQIETGRARRNGVPHSVVAPPGVLAHMARAVGLSPDQLEAVGRADAAEVLREIYRREGVLLPEGAYERKVAATPGVPAELVQQMLRSHRDKPDSGAEADSPHAAQG